MSDWEFAPATRFKTQSDVAVKGHDKTCLHSFSDDLFQVTSDAPIANSPTTSRIKDSDGSDFSEKNMAIDRVVEERAYSGKALIIFI